MGERARAIAESEYSLELQARRFADHYRGLLARTVDAPAPSTDPIA